MGKNQYQWKLQDIQNEKATNKLNTPSQEHTEKYYSLRGSPNLSQNRRGQIQQYSLHNAGAMI